MTKSSQTNDTINVVKDHIYLSSEKTKLAMNVWKEMRHVVSNSYNAIVGPDDSSTPTKSRNLQRISLPKNYPDTFDMYIGLNRLAEDARLVRSVWDERRTKDDDGNSALNASRFSLVLDASVFGQYSVYKDEAQYRGFDFIPDEWKGIARKLLDDNDVETEYLELKNHYGHALSRQLLLLNKPYGITESGIREISDRLAFYSQNSVLSTGEEKKDTSYANLRFADCFKALDELNGLVKRADVVKKYFTENEFVKYAANAFSQLVQTYQLPGVFQSYAKARLMEAIRFSENKRNLRELARNALQNGDVPEDKRRLFFEAVDAVQNDAPFMESVYLQFSQAYSTYRKIVFKDSDSGEPLRKGARDNLKAIIEINIYNQILTELDLEEYQFKYVTQNAALFGFIYGFEARHVIVPMVHPRYAFFLANPNISDEGQEAYRFYASLAEAFAANAIDRDRTYDPTELKKIHEEMVPFVTAMQSYHTANFEPQNLDLGGTISLDDILGHLDQFIKRLVEWVNASEKDGEDKKVPKLSIMQIEQLKRAIDGFGEIRNSELTNFLEDLFENTADATIGYSDALKQKNKFDGVFDVLVGLSEGSNQNETFVGEGGRTKEAHQQPEIYLRVHAEEGNNGERLPCRITCLPNAGRYRYIFAIHNSTIVQKFFDQLLSGKPENLNIAIKFSQREFFVKIRKLCNEVLEDANSDHIIRQKAESLKKFMEAFYSAHLGDFQLAESLISESIRIAEGSIEGAKEERKNGLERILHESYFFQHMVFRAHAQNALSYKACLRTLGKATRSLEDSARLLLSQRAYFYREEAQISPLSLRIELSKVGIMCEAYLVNKRFEVPPESQFDYIDVVDFSRLDDIDTGTQLDKFDFPSKRKGEVGTVSLEWISNLPEKLKERVAKIEKVFASARIKEEKVDASSFLWERIHIRIHDQYNFCELAALATRSSSEELREPTFWKNDLAQKQYDVLSRTPCDQDGTDGNICFDKVQEKIGVSGPLAGSVESIRKLYENLKSFSAPNSKYVSQREVAHALMHFDMLDDQCSRLSADGLPRFVVRRVKKEAVVELRKALHSIEQRLFNYYLADTVNTKDIYQ